MRATKTQIVSFPLSSSNPFPGNIFNCLLNHGHDDVDNSDICSLNLVFDNFCEVCQYIQSHKQTSESDHLGEARWDSAVQLRSLPPATPSFCCWLPLEGCTCDEGGVGSGGLWYSSSASPTICSILCCVVQNICSKRSRDAAETQWTMQRELCCSNLCSKLLFLVSDLAPSLGRITKPESRKWFVKGVNVTLFLPIFYLALLPSTTNNHLKCGLYLHQNSRDKYEWK